MRGRGIDKFGSVSVSFSHKHYAITLNLEGGNVKGVAISNGAFGRAGPTMYRCAYNHKRGERICTNKTQVRQSVLDSAILHAMSESLDERVLAASVTAALERLRQRQSQCPDQRAQLERELSLIQTRLRHVVELITNGRGTEAVIDSLHQEEARKKVVVGELDQLGELTQVVSLDAHRLARELRSRVGNLPALLARHVL